MPGEHDNPALHGNLGHSVSRDWMKFYPDYRANAFEDFVASVVHPDMTVLEIGAGSGTGHQNTFALRGRCARYAGVDLDPRVLGNPYLDEALVASAESLPFGDGIFDIVFHKMVAEHLRDPQTALKETARVLKPGGRLLFETPNRLYYPMVISRWTPTWFHRAYVRHLASGRVREEVFPTYYRLNDAWTIRKLCTASGLNSYIMLRSTPPGYLRFSRASFLLGVLYERTAERLMPALRGVIWVDARKVA